MAAKSAWLNYGIDILMLLTGITLVVSSVLVWVVIPKGYNPSWLLWIAIHKWSGFALMVEALLHLLLHGRWVIAMTRRLFGGRSTAR